MFKDDSINLTYKRLQLLETNDKSMKGVVYVCLCVCVCVGGGVVSELNVRGSL